MAECGPNAWHRVLASHRREVQPPEAPMSARCPLARCRLQRSRQDEEELVRDRFGGGVRVVWPRVLQHRTTHAVHVK